MVQIGDFNELEVAKKTPAGLIFNSEVGEILLPKKDVPAGTEIGDRLNLFIYTVKEGLLATTNSPKAKVGEFAYLEVKDVNRQGAFLDWGLDKDLFVPYREQRRDGMKKGKKYIVGIYLDKITKRITATAKINKLIEEEKILLFEGEEVDVLVYEFTDLGVTGIINNRYLGVVYKSDLYRDLGVGDRVTGYISKIRPDYKIDVTLRKTGRAGVEDAKDIILNQLKENDNFLPLNDKSSPEQIKNQLQISKKKFKDAIGGLYKERMITITDEGIRLK